MRPEIISSSSEMVKKRKKTLTILKKSSDQIEHIQEEKLPQS